MFCWSRTGDTHTGIVGGVRRGVGNTRRYTTCTAAPILFPSSAGAVEGRDARHGDVRLGVLQRTEERENTHTTTNRMQYRQHSNADSARKCAIPTTTTYTHPYKRERKAGDVPWSLGTLPAWRAQHSAACPPAPPPSPIQSPLMRWRGMPSWPVAAVSSPAGCGAGPLQGEGHTGEAGTKGHQAKMRKRQQARSPPLTQVRLVLISDSDELARLARDGLHCRTKPSHRSEVRRTRACETDGHARLAGLMVNLESPPKCFVSFRTASRQISFFATWWAGGGRGCRKSARRARMRIQPHKWSG